MDILPYSLTYIGLTNEIKSICTTFVLALGVGTTCFIDRPHAKVAARMQGWHIEFKSFTIPHIERQTQSPKSSEHTTFEKTIYLLASLP